MELEIKKIQLKNLQSYCESAEFKAFPILPISNNRVESYINNPRALPTDFVLYMAFCKGKLVGFRTILPDAIFIRNIKNRFGWFSGNWVNPEYRRRGVSTFLLNEVLKDWESQLMYTNYAPNSKALYDKTGEFELFTEKQGIRLYFKAEFEQLLVPRHKFFRLISPLLKIVDISFNIVLHPINHIKSKSHSKYLSNYEIFTKPNVEILAFLQAENKSVFKRGTKEFRWIFEYPWVTTSTAVHKSYPFTWHANSFIYYFIVGKNNQNEICDMAVIKLKDKVTSIPFVHKNNTNSNYLYKAILGLCYKQNTSILTAYNEDIMEYLQKQKMVSFLKKAMCQKYFILNKFKETLAYKNSEIIVNDGDGDCIFT